MPAISNQRHPRTIEAGSPHDDEDTHGGARTLVAADDPMLDLWVEEDVLVDVHMLSEQYDDDDEDTHYNRSPLSDSYSGSSPECEGPLSPQPGESEGPVTSTCSQESLLPGFEASSKVYELLDRPRAVLAYEVSNEDLFGPLADLSELPRAPMLSDCSVNRSSFGSSRSTSKGVTPHQVILLMGRVCTLGMDLPSKHQIHRDAKLFRDYPKHRKFPGTSTLISAEDLLSGGVGSVRFDERFSASKAYAAMLVASNQSPLFVFTDTSSKEDATPRREGPNRSSESGDTSSPPLLRIPQYGAVVELLMDKERQHSVGYRFWIAVNDPAINLGENCRAVLAENDRLQGIKANQKGAHTRGAGCDQWMSFSDYRCHLVRTLLLERVTWPGGEGTLHAPNMQKDNAAYLPHLLHPFYSVTKGRVRNVCVEQRDVRNYFTNLPKAMGNAESTTCPEYLCCLDEWLQPDKATNALRHLPTFHGAFPILELVTPLEYDRLNPRNLWSTRLPLPYVDREPVSMPHYRVRPSPLSEEDLRCAIHDERARRDGLVDAPFTPEVWRQSSSGTSSLPSDYDLLGHYPGADLHSKQAFLEDDHTLRFRCHAIRALCRIRCDRSKYETEEAFCDALLAEKIKLCDAFDRMMDGHLERSRAGKGKSDKPQPNPPVPRSFLAGWGWERSLSPDQLRQFIPLCAEFADPPSDAEEEGSSTPRRLSSFDNFLLQLCAKLRMGLDLNEGHTLTRTQLTISARNSALCEHADGIQALNILFYGNASAGKSYATEAVVDKISVPGHVSALSGLTENAFTSSTNRNYEVLVFQELPSCFFTGGAKATKGGGEGAVVKDMLTSGFVVKERNHYEDGVSTTVRSLARLKMCIVASNNDALETVEDALLRRFCLVMVSDRDNAVSNSSLVAEGHAPWTGVSKEVKDRYNLQLTLLTHWLPHRVERLIGVLGEVNMNVFHFWMPKLVHALKEQLGVTVDPRLQRQFFIACRVWTIIHACYVHLMSEVGYAWLWRGAEGREKRCIQSRDFIGIERYLVFQAEMLVPMIGMFKDILVPGTDMEILRHLVKSVRHEAKVYARHQFHSDGGTIGEAFGVGNPPQKRPSGNSKWDGMASEDTNYVRIDSSRSDLVSRIQASMHNKYPEEHILSWIRKCQSRRALVKPGSMPARTPPRGGLGTSASGQGRFNDGSPSALTTTTSLPILKFIHPSKTHPSNPHGWFLNTHVHAKGFFSQANDAILHIMVDLLQHDLTEPRSMVSLLPYHNRPGYLSAFRLVHVHRRPDVPLMVERLVPPPWAWNALIFGADPEARVTFLMAAKSLVVDSNPDILAVLYHFRDCGIPTIREDADGKERLHESIFSCHPAAIAEQCAKYRRDHPELFAEDKLPLRHYPSEMVRGIAGAARLHRKVLEIKNRPENSTDAFHKATAALSLTPLMLHRSMDESDDALLVNEVEQLRDFSRFVVEASLSEPMEEEEGSSQADEEFIILMDGEKVSLFADEEDDPDFYQEGGFGVYKAAPTGPDKEADVMPLEGEEEFPPVGQFMSGFREIVAKRARDSMREQNAERGNKRPATGSHVP